MIYFLFLNDNINILKVKNIFIYLQIYLKLDEVQLKNLVKNRYIHPSNSIL